LNIPSELNHIIFTGDNMTYQNFTADELQNEIWLPIVGYEPRYFISNLGRIKSIPDEQCRRKKTHLLKTFINKGGYERVGLTDQYGKQTKFYIHRLVAAAFIGECPEGFEVNHKHPPKHNNRLDNLEYLSKPENFRHAKETGLYPSGKNHHYTRRPETIRKSENHPLAKFTNDEVLKIRERLQNGESGLSIAKEKGVSKQVIYAIKNRKTWTEI
jgi:hypothetical protein